MILILTTSFDPHADYVAKRLQARGTEFIRFDPVEFPSGAELSVRYSPLGQTDCLLRLGTRSVDLAALRAVWYRRPQVPAPHEEITDRPTQVFVARECETFVQDVWNSLDCLWIPAPRGVLVWAQFKSSQLRVASAVGFELPPTLITNSPEDFLEFYRKHNGNIVSKLAGFSFIEAIGPSFGRYTEVVSKRDVAYASALRFCPVIFQAYVPKLLELRITVVGKQVFAAEIHSQGSNHTRHDWRNYDYYQTRYLPHELPQDVATCCLRLVEELGLCYGAIDMVITPDRRYVFLEINPNGQYLWIEEATGLPISDAICDLLMFGLPPRGSAQRRFHSLVEEKVQ
jgi:hypothetical protein